MRQDTLQNQTIHHFFHHTVSLPYTYGQQSNIAIQRYIPMSILAEVLALAVGGAFVIIVHAGLQASAKRLAAHLQSTVVC